MARAIRLSLAVFVTGLWMNALAQPPIFSKSFSPATIPVGGLSTLTFTIFNPSTTSSFSFSDRFPPAILINGASSTTGCLSISGTSDVDGHGISLFALVGTNSVCAISFPVTVSSPGVYTNTTGVITASPGPGGILGNSATATLTVGIANPSAPDAFQIGYAANLNVGDSVVNLSNAGFNGGFYGAGTSGNLCVNVYAFDPQEEEIGCCACLVTPDGLNSLSVKSDLISNSLTPATPNSVVIKLVATVPNTVGGAFSVCNPSTPILPLAADAGFPLTANTVAAGLAAWGSTLEPSIGTYGVVHAPFLNKQLSLSEVSALTTVCGFIQSNGSGYGICKSCRLGALGGAKQ